MVGSSFHWATSYDMALNLHVNKLQWVGNCVLWFSPVAVCVVAGNYESLPADRLPPVWLAYLSDPTDSGKIHNNVKQRWLQSKYWTFFTCQPSSTEYHLAIDCTEDEEVLKAMDRFAELTDQARWAALVCVNECSLSHALQPCCLTLLLNMSLSLFRDAIMKKDHERYSHDYGVTFATICTITTALTVDMSQCIYVRCKTVVFATNTVWLNKDSCME